GDPTVAGLDQAPELTLIKSSAYNDANSDGMVNVGDEITYTFIVTNRGNVTVTDISVTESEAVFTGTGTLPVPTYVADSYSGTGAYNQTLLPGESAVYRATYAITQQDIDAGGVTNQALVAGKDPGDGDVTDQSGTAEGNDDATEEPLEAPVITATAFGECINDVPHLNYTITPQNFTPAASVTATITWSDTDGNVIDEMTGLPLSGRILWPGAVVDGDGNGIDWPGWSFVDGQWMETADGFEGLRPQAVVTITVNPSVTLTVDYPPASADCYAAPTFVIEAADDQITNINGYDGLVDALNVFANDKLNAADVDPADVTLSVNGEEVTAAVPFYDDANNPTTQVVLNADGSVDVLPGTPAGTYTLNYTICENARIANCSDATITVNVVAAPIVAEDNTVDYVNGFEGDDDLGNVLDNDLLNGSRPAIDEITLTVTTPATPIDGGPVPVVDELTGRLRVPEGTPGGTYTIVYRICELLNPDNCDDATVTVFVATPSIALVKSAAIATDAAVAASGDAVIYTFTVTNTGNVPVSGIVINDTRIGVSGLTPTPATLAPGEVATATATYRLTQDDIDSGAVWNTAVATGEDPEGYTVADESDAGTDANGDNIADPHTVDSDGDGDPTNDPTGIELTRSLAITITKSTRPGEYVHVGDVITYDIVVTNTGNVTLTDIQLTDDNADAGSLSPATIARLLPGESSRATATHTITQADIDVGYVYNSAEAVGRAPNGEEVRDDSHDPDPADPDAPVNEDCNNCTITPIQMRPAVALVAVVTNTGSGRNGAFLVGDEIEYRFTVTNTGNMTLSGFVLNDEKLNLENVRVDETLAPGAQFTRVFRYVVTVADIAAGQVVTSARVRAEGPNGEIAADVSGDNVDNDVPTRVPVAEGPESSDDVASTPQHTPVTADVLENDEEGSSALDPRSVWLIDPATGDPVKTVTIDRERTYTVNDDGTITFSPIREFYGESAVRYVVSDVNGLRAEPATLTVTVVQSEPRASDDTATGSFNGPLQIQLVGNDQPDSAPLDPSTIEIISQPQHGTLRINGDGTVTYTPNQYYTGPDEFTYRVMDANGNWTNVATVRITVTGFHIPNIITPNGDGLNDRFVIIGLSDYDNAEVVLFNRWGNEVYRSRNYQQDWDGQGLNEGTYYYFITLRKDGQETVHKGWVLVKRK
ncbi:gliding motility-associated C-terminal domain-containing protein, partial [Parapedobacter sp. ISTM3]|uniref:DUF7507 domain-containing protein n=1 Tax=Parapedobacter sp. ISTM3 TaxID=2800130 RepID=UPI001904D548